MIQSRQKVILAINFANNEINGRGNNLFLASNVVFWKWIWHAISTRNIASSRFYRGYRMKGRYCFRPFPSGQTPTIITPLWYVFFRTSSFSTSSSSFWIRSCERSKPLGIDLLFIRNKILIINRADTLDFKWHGNYGNSLGYIIQKFPRSLKKKKFQTILARYQSWELT